MNIRLCKWGNSLAVRIPKSLLESAHLKEGDLFELRVSEDGSIVLRPARNKFTLDALLAGITPDNRHSEIDWGKPMGREES